MRQVLYGGDSSGASICSPASPTGEWRWTPVVAAGGATTPPDRAAHAAAAWGAGAMVVVGGAALDGSGELADVWVLR